MEDSLEKNLIGPVPADRQYAGGRELPVARSRLASSGQAMRGLWQRVHLGKIVTFAASLFLFVLAITFMKEGARGVAPLVRDVFSVTSTSNSLGFGWLFSYTIMSGSPVAAAALTFYDAGVVDKLGAFAMITGSRLGANFIVLLIGFLYVLRGRDRATSLGMGLLSLTVTATTYLPGLFLGAIFLRSGLLDGLQLRSGALLLSVTDLVIDPIAGLVTAVLPDWGVFLAGLGVILLSFSLFDRCLPTMALKESHVGRLSRLVYKPAVMFFLGALVTLVSMSVSLSLSILVPLSNRGFVRRENVIPYIMGANITTFIDTLLAAVLLKNPPAFTIVFVEMFSVTVISLAILAVVYRPYQRGILRFVNWITVGNRNLAIFMTAIVAIPVILVLV
jgi:sodium-dependent phosphate cotransporter